MSRLPSRIENERRALLASEAIRGVMDLPINEEDLQALYAEKYANQDPETEYHAAHILVKTEDEAKDIITQLDDGADFGELAKTLSTGPSGPSGGDLGWFIKTDMVPEFADAAFALEPGTVSDPVKSDFGWHLIKVDDARDRAVPPLEQVQGELMGSLVEKAQAEILAELRAQAEVVRPEPRIPAQAIRADDLLDAAE